MRLELPEAFGFGVSAAQAEEAEVCEHDDEAEDGEDHEHGGEEEGNERAEWVAEGADIFT